MLRASLSVLLLTLVGVSSTTAQTQKPASTSDTVYLAAVREFAREMVPGGRALDDSSQAFFLEDSVDPGSYFGFLNRCLEDSSTFTTPERAQIKGWANHPAFQVWTLDMAPGVRLIPKDTITAIFSRKHRDGWSYFYGHYGLGYHSLGCPLFLRNYTWCLFYSGHHCGWLCGDGQLALYKKEGGRWVFVKNWGEWMS
jgi:hypothetical protein